MKDRPDDRCTTRTGTGRTKNASGITVYLVEELSDARMRCAQLKNLVSAATDLVEKSEKRDHLFEVAAHLIHGIPDALFRLEKALDAASMSAARMDYEEIKQTLRPEKAEEMAQVFQDARLRYLNRRSQQLASPTAATAEIERLATISEQTGQVPVGDLLVLAAALEMGVKTASEEPQKTAAERLREIAKGASAEKSRATLAAALRSFLAGALQPTAGQALQAVIQTSNSREEVMKGFKESNPDLTEEQLKTIADHWEANKNVVKDKAASTDTKAVFFKLYHQMSADLDTFDMAWTRYSKDPVLNKHKLDDALMYMNDLRSLADVMIRNMELLKAGKTASADDEKLSRHEEGKSVDPTENMSDEDAKKWHAMKDEHGDNFKTAFVPDALSAERVMLYVDSMRERMLIAQRSLKVGDWRHFKISLKHLTADMAAIFLSIGMIGASDKLGLVQRELISLPLGSGAEQPAPRMASTASEMWGTHGSTIQADSREKVMEGFKEANPDLTDAQLEEIADHWEANKNVVKDKQAEDVSTEKTASADPLTGAWSVFSKPSVG